MIAKPIEDSCRMLIKRFKKQIKSILFNNNILTLVVSDKKAGIQHYSKKLPCSIEIKLARDYFMEVLAGGKETYSEIRASSILYDPGHLLDSIQEMISKGEIVGTRESLLRKFIAIGEHFRKIDLIKYRVLDNIYRSTLDLSQALILEKHNIFSTQRDTVKYLELFFVKRGKLEKKYLNTAKEIITAFKDIEHKKREIVSGEELDLLQKNAELFRHRLLELLEEGHKFYK